MALPIDPVTGLQNSTYAAKKGASQDLGSVDFMKLIIAQMRNQNPLEPQKDSDFMAQMAQFESLNQMKLVAQGMKVLQGVNELSSAAGMLGKTVSGKMVNGVGVVRDMVAREKYSLPFAKLTSEQRGHVDNDERVQVTAADAQNAGRDVSGTVDRVVVGPDGIPMLFVSGRVVDMFTVSEVR
jgi:flagellar basal-body rod modification protein FlgD